MIVQQISQMTQIFSLGILCRNAGKTAYLGNLRESFLKGKYLILVFNDGKRNILSGYRGYI